MSHVPLPAPSDASSTSRAPTAIQVLPAEPRRGIGGPQDVPASAPGTEPRSPLDVGLPRPLVAAWWMFRVGLWKNVATLIVMWLWVATRMVWGRQSSSDDATVMVIVYLFVVPISAYVVVATLINAVMMRSIVRAGQRARWGYTIFAVLFLITYALVAASHLLLFGNAATDPYRYGMPSPSLTPADVVMIVVGAVVALVPFAWTVLLLRLVWHPLSRRYYTAGFAAAGGPPWGSLLMFLGAPGPLAALTDLARRAWRSRSPGSTNRAAAETPPRHPG